METPGLFQRGDTTLPDFEMINRKFEHNRDITVIPLADVHLGSPQCMEQEFIAFIESIRKRKDIYLVLGGDLIDNGTRNSLTSPFHATMPPSVQKREMANILMPVRDRILCMIPGNHERRSSKECDDDPILDISCMLNLEHLYRENIAFLHLQFGQQTKSNGVRQNSDARPSYNLVVVHGSGGGILTGGAVNRAERFADVIDGMDALIVGHTHKPFNTQPGKILIDARNNQVTIKPFKIVSMTSWLKYGGYAARGMMRPTTHCLQTITFRGNKKEMIVTS